MTTLLCRQAAVMLGATGWNADERELKRRKLAAETAKVELELAKARGEVVPLRQLERALANTFAEVKTNLRSIPSRVATAIIGE
jgi:phage terminase Nu1 subunit (DNA packaging protein)